MNYSTFPAELLLRPGCAVCNAWLQCGSMRIELPPASWAETAHRAEDDAHTMTVAVQPAPDWVRWQWPAEPTATRRTAVAAIDPLTVTITL